MSSRLNCSHKQSRERNEKFAQVAQDPEVKKFTDNIPKSTVVSYLRNLCEKDYGFTIPASAAYKVMSTIDERFKPKHRRTTTANQETFAEDFVEVEPKAVSPALAGQNEVRVDEEN